MRQVPNQWVRDLNPEDKEAFLKILLGPNVILEKLVKILKEQLASLRDLELTDSHFTSPEWATRQAFFSGQIKQLRDILRLLEFPEAPDQGVR